MEKTADLVREARVNKQLKKIERIFPDLSNTELQNIEKMLLGDKQSQPKSKKAKKAETEVEVEASEELSPELEALIESIDDNEEEVN